MTQQTKTDSKPAALTHANVKADKGAAPKKHQNKKPQRSYQQTQMAMGLSSLFGFATQRADGRLPDLDHVGEEGVDHINVHRTSKTELGHLLSTAALLDFMLFGKRFTCVDNLMMFYRSHCTVEALTTATVGTSREFNRNKVKRYPNITNLFVVVCLAYVELFKRYPELTKAMELNTLPLDSYFIGDKGKRQRYPASATTVQAIQEAFQSVRDGRDPDVKKFLFTETTRTLATRAGLAGQTLLEVVRQEFSPRQMRENFQANHAELAETLRLEAQWDQAERDTRRGKQGKGDKKPRGMVATLEDQPMELGDTNDILGKTAAPGGTIPTQEHATLAPLIVDPLPLEPLPAEDQVEAADPAPIQAAEVNLAETTAAGESFAAAAAESHEALKTVQANASLPETPSEPADDAAPADEKAEDNTDPVDPGAKAE